MFSFFKNSRSKKSPRLNKRSPKVQLNVLQLEDRITPSFSLVGNTLTVMADSSTDHFALVDPEGATAPEVFLNGTPYNGPMTNIQNIDFVGRGGHNLAVVDDFSGFDDTLVLNGSSGTLQATNFTLVMSAIPTINASGTPSASVVLNGDTQHTNTYTDQGNSVTMTTSVSSDTASGFGNVTANAETAKDTAALYAPATLFGITVFDVNFFASAGNVSEIFNSANLQNRDIFGFHNVKIYAGGVNGGAEDSVSFTGDPNSTNTFTYNPGDAKMASANYTTEAFGFTDNITATAGTANDVANLHGSTSSENTLFTKLGTDGTIEAVLDYAAAPIDQGGTGVTTLVAADFSLVHAYSETTDDQALLQTMSGTPATFIGAKGDSKLMWGDQTIELTNYPNVEVTSLNAGDVAFLNGTNTASTFIGTADQAEIFASDYNITVNYFQDVHANAIDAADTATLIGSSTSPNQYVGLLDDSTLTGSWGGIEITSFHHVTAEAGTAQDTAVLYGGAGSKNTFTYDLHTGTGVIKTEGETDTVEGFDSVNAYNGTSSDVATLKGALETKNTFIGDPEEAIMSAGAETVTVHNFPTVNAQAGTPQDVATLHGDEANQNSFTYSLENLTGTYYSSGRTDIVSGFYTVDADAGTKSDTANLFGSKVLANYFTAGPETSPEDVVNQDGVIETTLTDGTDTAVNVVETLGFNFVTAHVETNSDVAHLNGLPNETNTFYLTGGDDPQAAMYGTGYGIHVDGYGYVRAQAGTPDDTVYLSGDNPGFGPLGASVSDGTGIGDGTYDLVAAGFVRSHVFFI